MNTTKIKQLLEAFYNGETNSDEEQILMEYFNGDNVAEEMIDEKIIFLSIYQKEPIKMPLSLDSKLRNLIDELDKKEKIEQKEKEPELKIRSNNRTYWRWLGGVAAGIALLIFAGLFIHNRQEVSNKPVTASQGTQQTENLSESDKQKIKEAEDALILLSSKFNKGTNQLAIVSSNIDKTNEILNRTFNRKKEKES